MEKSAKIYIAGHRGLVGSAIFRRLEKDGYTNLVVKTHKELDLTNQQAVEDFFHTEKPEYVFLAAAKVGGIMANKTYPADFIYLNTMIAFNVINSAYRHGVKKLLNLGSSCIYPKLAPQPLKEEYILTASLESTNEAYAIAKISAIKLCRYYNQQYGTNYISGMPTNLYGPGDNFDLNNSHVLPALMRKFHEAKVSGTSEVTIWGTGTPLREFLYSDDLADACLFLMKNIEAKDAGEHVNIGTGTDLTISELAKLMAQVVGYKGSTVYDKAKPDGTPRKLMDVNRLTTLGWKATTTLEEGIKKTYEIFKKEYKEA